MDTCTQASPFSPRPPGHRATVVSHGSPPRHAKSLPLPFAVFSSVLFRARALVNRERERERAFIRQGNLSINIIIIIFVLLCVLPRRYGHFVTSLHPLSYPKLTVCLIQTKDTKKTHTNVSLFLSGEVARTLSLAREFYLKIQPHRFWHVYSMEFYWKNPTPNGSRPSSLFIEEGNRAPVLKATRGMSEPKLVLFSWFPLCVF